MPSTCRSRLLFPAILVWLTLAAGTAIAQPSYAPKNDEPNPYQPGASWGQLPQGRAWGSTAGVDTAPDGTIWAYDRCGANSCAASSVAPILHFDTSGTLITSFGAGMFNFPHGITVDKDGNVWVTDHGVNPPNGRGQVVYKFSKDGKVLMTLGKPGVAGNGPDTFNQPSDVLVAPNGGIFVADGHGPQTNARIVQFDKDGKFVKTWGTHGSGDAELEGPHALAMDSRGRLFVGDRTNNRVQAFDRDGKLLASWKQFGRPSGIFIDRNDMMYVTDSESREDNKPGDYGHNPGVKRGIRIGSVKDGKVVSFIPDPKPTGGSSTSEGVAVDRDGNVYGAEVGPRDMKKYVKVRTMSENETLVREFIKAWSRLNAAELAAYFAEDGCYINIPTQPVCGRANIEKMIAGFIATWTETVWDVKTLVAAGDVVIAERLDKTKTTKGNVDLPCVGIFEMRAGKIGQWRDYFDLATFRNAMKG